MADVRLVHATALLIAPRLGAPILALLVDTGSVELLSSDAGFLRVRHGASEGYLPAALCDSAALPTAAGELRQTAVSQPVLLYAQPAPGQQFAPDAGKSALQWLIQPDEVLGLLGRSDHFVLVQRPSGQIGYVPAELVRAALPLEMARSNSAPLVAVWIGLGFGGALLNWIGLFGLMVALPVPEAARPYLALALLLAAASALWFSPRRRHARSLAVGALLCYGAMHLASNGWLTFWR